MDEKAFSSIDLVCQCLIDEARSKAFCKAIESVVKPTHTVIDVGTGSGVMALFAARAGAKRVFALEFDPYVANITKGNILENGYDKKIKLLVGDACRYKYAKGAKFDVVIMEMLTTAMVDEFQIQAINNLHRQKVVSKDTVFVPYRLDSFASVGYKDFKMYGFEFKMVKHLWNNLSENHKVNVMSDDILMHSVDFSKVTAERFEKVISFPVFKNGTINCVLLSSLTFLTKDMILKDTETLNAPVVFPIAETKVKKGDMIKLKISYKFGAGYNNFKVKIVK